MRRIVAIIAAVVLSLTITAQPAAADPPVENYGQCIRFLIAIGVNPSEFRPPVIGAGPSVLFPNPNDPLHPIKIVGAQAWEFGVSCHYELPE